MVRRVAYTSLALLLAFCAFTTADPQPDINLFGVMFLFFAYVAWFYWDEIQAGYAYLDDRNAGGDGRRRRDGGSGGRGGTDLLLMRFAPMHIREFIAKPRSATDGGRKKP